MKIAICDDELDCLEKIKNILLSINPDIPNISIAQFTNGRELLDCYVKQQRFDLVFLDVEMPEISGLQTGEKIRDYDRDIVIVFLTSHKQYVFESLRLDIFDYLIKPVESDAILDTLSRAYKRYKEQHPIVKLKWQSQSYALDANDIVYIEGYNRHTVFFTTEGKYECVGRLNNFESMLMPYGFMRCHQGFLINMKYIESIEKDSLKATTGHVVPISVRKKQECLCALNNYLARYQI